MLGYNKKLYSHVFSAENIFRNGWAGLLSPRSPEHHLLFIFYYRSFRCKPRPVPRVALSPRPKSAFWRRDAAPASGEEREKKKH